MVCGLLPALSVSTRVPANEPAEDGEKLTLTLQLAPGARSTLQVLVAPNGPFTLIVATISVAVPLFVMVTVCAVEVVPCVTGGKLSAVVLRLASATPAGPPAKS